jgi:hypothetical protein
MKWCINWKCDEGYRPYHTYISDNGVKLEGFMNAIVFDSKIRTFRTKDAAINYNSRYNKYYKDTEIIEAEPVLLWFAEEKLRQL